MKTNKLINSLNAGELSPLIDARIDQEKYQMGCRTMENAYPLIYGGAERRPGTQLIASQKTQSAKGRVVSFEHSVDDTYVLLFENQVIRVFKEGAQVYTKYGTEDLSDFSANLVAHWKCDDNAANTTVADAVGAHNGTASANTSSLTTTDQSGTASEAFDMQATYYVTASDHADFTFGDASSDSPFTLMAWVYWEPNAGDQVIVSKYNPGANREWRLYMNRIDATQGNLRFEIYDDTVNTSAYIKTQKYYTAGWYFVVATYTGIGGATPTDGMKIYVNWVQENVSAVNTGSYVAMDNFAADVIIGADTAGGGNLWEGKIDNVAILDKALTEVEIASLVGSSTTSAYEITTPYLTADLLALDIKQSADVMYIAHPNYEPRKLSRLGDTVWKLETLGINDGPFREENTDTNAKITASATTGSVTLTATGCNPFIAGTTAGHSPNGTAATSKSLTGSLFKLVHARSTPQIGGLLDVTGLNSTSTLTVYKGNTWDLVTNGTWGAAGDPATVVLERSYDSGSTYETIVSFTSAANYNIDTTDTEESDDALYRLRVTDSAVGGGNCTYNLSVRDTGQIGIVKITAVASSTSATATVLSTLASTSATHRWSEGAWNNYRGWPRTVDISPEERLTFSGSLSKPLTSWGSVISEFTSFKAGTADDDAVIFTLIGTGQQNTIQWVVPRTSLMIGTVGGEHLLGASTADEALTPSNVTAKIKGTRGSERIHAILVNDAILFLQRGGRKIRELSNVDTYDASVYRADDLTVFSEHITESGIVDWAYQRTPDPMLWCVRDDGEIAVMMYERQQEVFSWARVVLAGTDAKAESVCVIYGGAGNEDQVWITVSRTVNSATVRNVERFKPRDWGSTLANAFFVDSGITDTGGDTTITGLDHLEGETVQVFGDGLVQATKVVSGGSITAATTASKYQVGLGYDTTIKPMKIDLGGLGIAVKKKITEGTLSLYKTIGGKWGDASDNMYDLDYVSQGESLTALFTGDLTVPFDGGYDRSGDIIIQQTNPVPMTVRALILDVGAHNF